MRIVVDLQGAQTGSRHRGIGRYSLAITKALIEVRRDVEVLVVLNGLLAESLPPVKEEFAELLPPENIFTWYAPGPVNWVERANLKRREDAELIRECFIASLKPDLLLLTSVIEGASDDTVTTVKKYFDIPTAAIFYDLIPLQYPNDYLRTPVVKEWYREKTSFLKDADLLLAISESSANEAVALLGIDEEKLVNIGAASDERFAPRSLSPMDWRYLKERFSITRSFVLYTSATDERKNHLKLIEAFAALPLAVRREYQLVIAGFLPEVHALKFRLHAKKHGLKLSDLVITGRISDQELVTLYNGCEVFIFPSLHEGFGLPALEAMQCGAAVIASNSSSLPEVVGRKDALFDPRDVESIAAKLNKVLTDDHFRNHLKVYGPVQASRFCWKRSAEVALLNIKNISPLAAPSFPSGIYDSAEITGRINPGLTFLIDQFRQRNRLDQSPNLPAALANSFPRRLLVDVSELVKHDSGTGIQRVVKAVLSELLENPPRDYQVCPIYADEKTLGYKYAVRFSNHFQGLDFAHIQELHVDAWAGDVFLGLDLQQFVVSFQKSLLDEWHQRGVKIHFVVYDILPLLYPDYFPEWVPSIHQSWMQTVSRYDGLVCISQAVEAQVKQWLASQPVDIQSDCRARLGWFHLGSDIGGMSLLGQAQVAELGKVIAPMHGAKTFLMVGTVEPRKGHRQVLQAFEKLWATGLDVNLVIVGKKGWKQDKLAEQIRSHPQLGMKLHWHERVDDGGLDIIYAVSTCLIMASEAEGFGLPLTEAAKYDLPIIARDIQVFREVAEGHAFYFEDSKDPQVVAKAIEAWLELYRAGSAPSSAAMELLSWSESTAALLGNIFRLEP